MNREDVVKELLKQFPSIEAELTDDTWTGLLHLEIACFARYTQFQIDNNNKDELRRCFQAAHKFLHDGDKEVRNAIYVSYLEHLDFKDGKKPRSWAMREMSSLLRTGYEDIMKYLEDLAKSSTKGT